MGKNKRDRRQAESGVRLRPRSSPANILVLTVIGVLGAMAAAAALFGTGLEETTPHGQVLTSLHRVAEAQERHHQETGTFARWIHTLDVETPEGVRVDLVRGDDAAWEAIAGHPVGLTCLQGGRYERGAVQRDQPICYTDP
jgi:hypothetical protein